MPALLRGGKGSGSFDKKCHTPGIKTHQFFIISLPSLIRVSFLSASKWKKMLFSNLNLLLLHRFSYADLQWIKQFPIFI